jgi:osmotically-inducible protein OsmY
LILADSLRHAILYKVFFKGDKKMKKLSISIILMIMLSSCASLTGRTAGELIDDQSISNEIHLKIVQDPDIHYFHINVDTFRGNVTLTGVAPSKEAEQRLVEIIKMIRGVKSVTSSLSIDETLR